MLDRIRKYALPALIFLVIFVAFVYRLSSCTLRPENDKDGISASGSGAAPSESPKASPADKPGPAEKYTDEDIREVFKKYGFEVRSIKNAGNIAAVEFIYPKCSGLVPSRFAWIDRETSAYDVVTNGLLTDAFEVSGDTLTARTTGLDISSNTQWFPKVFISRYTADPDTPFTPRFHNELLPYYMPVEKSFTLGKDRPVILKCLTFGFDGVSAGFMSRSGAGETADDVPAIPRTSVACSGGYCYITFYDAILSPDFQAPTPGTGDALRTFAAIDCDGANTLLKLRLGEKAARYHVAAEYSPDDGMPFAVITFRSNDSVSYPPGW